MNVSMPMIGVNGENNSRHWRQQGQLGELTSHIVRSVDQEGTTGMPIAAGDLRVVDQSDGVSPQQRITWNDRTLPQRQHLMQQITAALDSVDINGGDDQPLSREAKAALADQALTRWETARGIFSSDSSIQYFRDNPITVAELARLGRWLQEHSDATDDSVITAVFQMRQIDPLQFRRNHRTALEQLSTLTANGSLENILNNSAFADYGHLDDLSSLTGTNRQIVEDARTRAETLILESFPGLQQATTLEAIRANTLFQCLQTLSANSPLWGLLTQEQRAVYDRAVALTGAGTPTYAEAVLIQRGISFTIIDADRDGNITLDELRTAITAWNARHPNQQISITPDRLQVLFNAIDNHMRLHGQGNGQIDQDEFNRFIQVITQLSEATGLSPDQVIEAYLTHDLVSVDIGALRAERTRIIGGLEGATLTSAYGIRTALTGLGVAPTIIDSIIARLGDDLSAVDATRLANTITLMIFEAHTGTSPQTGEVVAAGTAIPSLSSLSATSIGLALSGVAIDEAMGQRVAAELNAHIFNDPNLFQAGMSERGTGYLQAARQHILDQMINAQPPRLAEAECALAMLADPSSVPGGNASMHIQGIENSPELLNAFAQGYIRAGNYTRAASFALRIGQADPRNQALNSIAEAAANGGGLRLAYSIARQIDNASAREQILTRLVGICMNNIGEAEANARTTRLNLAWQIMRTPGFEHTEKIQMLEQLARHFAGLATEDRQTALNVIDAIIAINANHPISSQGQAPIPVSQYRQQIEDQLRIPLAVYTQLVSVFRGNNFSGDPDLTRIEAAVTALEAIVDNDQASVEDRAYAYYALGQIFKAQADSIRDGQIPQDGNWTGTQAYRLYDLMARCARQAAALFQNLHAETGHASADRPAYHRMIGQSSGLIGQLLLETGPLHWASREGAHGYQGSDAFRPGHSRIQRSLGELARYIPQVRAGRPSVVSVIDAQGRPVTEGSARVKSWVHLRNDQERSDSGSAVPDDIIGSYQAILGTAPPASADAAPPVRTRTSRRGSRPNPPARPQEGSTPGAPHRPRINPSGA